MAGDSEITLRSFLLARDSLLGEAGETPSSNPNSSRDFR
jgi:hypothetical protein